MGGVGTPGATALRRVVLAASVVYEIDLTPRAYGLVLAGRTPVNVTWPQIARALDGAEPDTDLAVSRLAGWLRMRRRVADEGPARFAAQLSLVGLPVGHPLHPGPSWPCLRVLGGALDLGFGLPMADLEPAGQLPVTGQGDTRAIASCAVAPDAGAPPAAGEAGLEPDRLPVPMPPGVLPAEAADPARRWPEHLARLELMGSLEARRWRRDGEDVLRPMGGFDVVTLLGAASLRAELVSGHAGGLRAVAVPMRIRGWTRLSRLDPAFVPAAASASAPAERGFPRPVLVTAEEVTLARAGPGALHQALADPLPAEPWDRSVLYR